MMDKYLKLQMNELQDRLQRSEDGVTYWQDRADTYKEALVSIARSTNFPHALAFARKAIGELDEDENIRAWCGRLEGRLSVLEVTMREKLRRDR